MIIKLLISSPYVKQWLGLPSSTMIRDEKSLNAMVAVVSEHQRNTGRCLKYIVSIITATTGPRITANVIVQYYKRC